MSQQQEVSEMKLEESVWFYDGRYWMADLEVWRWMDRLSIWIWSSWIFIMRKIVEVSGFRRKKCISFMKIVR